MKLVVGLGNPGRKYLDTRHNVGFMVIDDLAGRWRYDRSRAGFGGQFGTGHIGSEKTLLLKPETFMNRSGQSVQEAMAFYKLGLEDLLVVSDDLALPLGRLRLRAKGSAGGHNGLANVIERLGDNGFARLRIGIGSATGERMVSHVLSPFQPEERETVLEAVGRASESVACWIEEGIETAMNRFNATDA
jgi:PTH1 family peptidyl-tRNA hydrolase